MCLTESRPLAGKISVWFLEARSAEKMRFVKRFWSEKSGSTVLKKFPGFEKSPWFFRGNFVSLVFGFPGFKTL